MPDMGTFVQRFPRVVSERAVRDGANPELVDYIVKTYDDRGNTHELADIVMADLTVTSTLRDGARIGFEVTVRGRMGQRPFIQALCLVFQIAGGRVVAFHEYLAWPDGLDPLAFAEATGPPRPVDVT